jgi:protein SCO1/2
MKKMDSRKSNFRLVLLAMFVGLISAVAGISFWRVMQGPPQPSNATLIVLPEPRVIADFALFDDEGAAFSLDNLRGHWSLIFFGFTHCPDVCPTALLDLKQIHEELLQIRGDAATPHQVLFVSVDPERDTAEQLHSYVNYFHSDFIGVTGPEEQLGPLTMQLGIAYRVEAHEPGSTQYNVDHSISIMLTDPEGRLHGVFPAPHDADRMAAELADAIE